MPDAPLYTIPERVHINGWGASQDAPRKARFRLRNGGSSVIGPIDIAGPRTSHFEVDGPRKVASLGPDEAVAFTVQFLVPRNHDGANVQDACVFSVAGNPQCYILFQASRDNIDAHQATFYPPESDLVPRLLRPSATAPAVATPDEGRPRSGRASRAVTEVMKARGSGGGAPLVMLHPDREDLFFMEGLWYDSRGLEWEATSKSPRAVDVEPDEPCAMQVMSRHQLADPYDSVASTSGAPPDWVMGMLDSDTTDEPQQRKTSDSDSYESRTGSRSRPPGVAAKQNSEQAVGLAMHHSTAAGTPAAPHGTVGGGDPEDSDEHDDFVDLLEEDLSRKSTHPARKTTGAWKMAPVTRSSASDNGFDEEDGGYAEQLASELQRGVAAATPATTARPAVGRPKPNKYRRPTAAQRREQDAKWMACS